MPFKTGNVRNVFYILYIIDLFANFAVSYYSTLKNRLVQLQVTQILNFKQ